MREPKELGSFTIPGLTGLAPGLSDAGIGLAGALLLFILRADDPVSLERRPLLTWGEARNIPWDVLLLFGGGLSLAAAIESTGLARWMANLLSGLEGASPVLVIATLAIVTVALSELASNAAVAALAMPIAAGLAGGAGLPIPTVMLAAGLAASAGFALPIATPPNAIAYGSGRIASRDMLKAGLVLDLISVVVVTAVVLALGWVIT